MTIADVQKAGGKLNNLIGYYIKGIHDGRGGQARLCNHLLLKSMRALVLLVSDS